MPDRWAQAAPGVTWAALALLMTPSSPMRNSVHPFFLLGPGFFFEGGFPGGPDR